MSVERGAEFVAGDAQLGQGSQDTPARESDWMRGFEVCALLGISDETWRIWRKSGLAPAPVPNVPGRPRWLRSQIEDFRRGLVGGRRRYFASARRG